MARKRRYHHENLKQELLEAAVLLVGELGLQAFTLREVARRAGVSHNAPYRHFHDKDDLLAAVAAEGFDRLSASMLEEMSSGQSAMERLRLSGRGYVRFALGWPQHLMVMFETAPPPDPRPEYVEAARRAFQVLLDAIAAVQAEGGLPQGDPQPLAVVAWSAVHGFAKLSISGRLPFGGAEILAFTDFLTRATLEGMSNLPHPAARG